MARADGPATVEREGRRALIAADDGASPSAWALLVLALAVVGCGAPAPAPRSSPQATAEDERYVFAGPRGAPDLVPAGRDAFDRDAARLALESAATEAKRCKREGEPVGLTTMQVTFVESGSVTSASSKAPFAGTSVGTCMSGVFAAVRIPAFRGTPVTVTKSVKIE